MKIGLIDPSGAPDHDALEINVPGLESLGFPIERRVFPVEAGERLARGGIDARTRLLIEALHEFDILLCARGGYGVSDLLPALPFDEMSAWAPRLVAGFSDITALQCALYARLGWQGLHAPMPGSALWRPDGEDVAAVIGVLRDWPGPCRGRMPVRGDEDGSHGGPLFGGCFSVLGALIGTPYFPESLAGHVVFIEDVNESAPRVLRCLNQWIQSGAMESVEALVVGRFEHVEPREREALATLPERIRERVDCPVFESDAFGHVRPNLPMMIGARATLRGGALQWEFSPGEFIA